MVEITVHLESETSVAKVDDSSSPSAAMATREIPSLSVSSPAPNILEDLHRGPANLVDAVGFGKSITACHQGKCKPSQAISSSSPYPFVGPSFSDLTVDESPPGWMQHKLGDFPIEQEPAHDVAALEAAALSPGEPQLPTC